MKEPMEVPWWRKTVAMEGMQATMRPTFASTMLCVGDGTLASALRGEGRKGGSGERGEGERSRRGSRHDVECHHVPGDVECFVVGYAQA